jgi:hypothetical protein
MDSDDSGDSGSDSESSSGSGDEEEEADEYNENFFDAPNVDLTNYFTKDEVTAKMMQFVSYQEIKDLKEEVGKRHDEDFGSL